MSETPPNVEGRAEKRRMIATFARELSENREAFAFPGIDDAAYARIKAGEDEYPGFTTPIDELIARCRAEGMKVVLSPADPESGNTFILPCGSNDTQQDMIMPEQLDVANVTDPTLRNLILATREYRGL